MEKVPDSLVKQLKNLYETSSYYSICQKSHLKKSIQIPVQTTDYKLDVCKKKLDNSKHLSTYKVMISSGFSNLASSSLPIIGLVSLCLNFIYYMF